MSTLPEKIVSIYPPTIINTSDGGRYVVYSGSGWFPVDEEFTQEQAMSHWVQWTSKSKETLNESIQDKSWQVESSKRGSYYTVRYLDGKWGCNCPANTYHRGRECRHIKQIKEKVK